ncbi:hypothetical protein M378DRAFT_71592 [Amanita muscaria Koide BX008]|uniref:Uncharacterized protein n=1 Tax=Amanita muscaria (strain Koide BX008) TaxID=946122 RepID=A0A0C2XGF9_AMAMK|nr:hypothetical protein M378DRAFT_71592 [Amanita muscaria Koide BX008]
MAPSDMYFMEGYGLLEAMSAIEIGEPRLDTGLIKDNEDQTPFDPTTPLLPEEICWILDRAYAYEMEWHTGRVLSHTVFTLVYIHELPNLEPDFTMNLTTQLQDPFRPTELITIVLRSAVQGLLKCCDLSWRELSSGDMLDTEDWQSDKCEVSLLEGMPTKAVIARLEESVSWVFRSTKVPEDWRQPLIARIMLRKSFLQLLECQLHADPMRFVKVIEETRRWLAYVRSHPSSELKSDSPARRAFDPMIIRRLSAAVPASKGAEPDVEWAWCILGAFLDDLHDLCFLATTLSITAWENMGNWRIWSAGSRRQLSYVRSFTQRTFYNGVLVLHHFPFKWLVDRFFLESLGVPYESILRKIGQRWNKKEPPPIQNLERILFTVGLVAFINLRRYLAKSLVIWHRLYDLLLDIKGNLKRNAMPLDDVLQYLPTVVLHWRLSIIQEMIFSAFQLELYSPVEIPFAYWYATKLIEIRLDCLDNLMLVLPNSSLTYHEYRFQKDFLTALQHISMALFFTTLSMVPYDWDSVRPTFYSRYKWAYKPEYDRIKATQIPFPSLHRFIRTCEGIALSEVLEVSPADMIHIANVILKQLSNVGLPDGWAGPGKKYRVQFLQTTLAACERLEALPSSFKEIESFNIGLLKWDIHLHPWFPSLVEEDSGRRKKSYVRHL